MDLDAFVANEYPKVVAAVGMITGNRQDAAGAVQDALAGFLAKPPARDITNVAAWITVVASNRARGIRKAGVDAVPTDDDGVTSAIEKLPLQQRQVCVLHYLLDQSVETIAEGLGVSEGTIKTQLFRARKALAAQLRREDHHG